MEVDLSVQQLVRVNLWLSDTNFHAGMNNFGLFFCSPHGLSICHVLYLTSPQILTHDIWYMGHVYHIFDVCLQDYVLLCLLVSTVPERYPFVATLFFVDII